MRNAWIVIIFLTTNVASFGQGKTIDTLRWFSDAFQAEREIYVHTPEFYDYQSEDFPNPVIFLLDGQHKWFAEPVLNDIRYLQFTHDIPHAITVVIPHIDRVAECRIDGFGSQMPLHRMIVEELPEVLKGYKLSEHKILIGHSFSASFALYSFSQNQDFYSAIFAHSPLDQLSKTLQNIAEENLSRLYISGGSPVLQEDGYHRVRIDSAIAEHGKNRIHFYPANSARHTTVPIITNAQMLTDYYDPYSQRTLHLAEVDMNYQLVEMPTNIDSEWSKIQESTFIHQTQYPLELPEINGLSSRYYASGLLEYSAKIMEYGMRWYPTYYEFPLFWADYVQDKTPERALESAKHALELYDLYERDLPDYAEYRIEIIAYIKDLKLRAQEDK